ncbi:sigma-70 family RNA polymerase sigma factor [Metabacillus sp. Hm71]|uniref:sigma-70 family RNA polymerase sigma factor n=1 Tax=Metabacillus sp. Hm71 TaxID=3450743 RepID=UPI003F439146
MHRNVSNEFSQQQMKIEDILPSLLTYCRFLTKCRWDGEDIAQEAVLKAIEKYGQKPEVLSPALLKKIAYNQWIDTVRKRKKESLETEIEVKEAAKDSALDVLDLVQFLISHFTPKQAVILFLKEAFGYRSSEIAEILGTTEMAVKAILHRTKKRIEHHQNLFELVWEKEEEQLLSELFYDSLIQQDPTILIRRIPAIHSLRRETQLPSKTLSPSCGLCMAA